MLGELDTGSKEKMTNLLDKNNLNTENKWLDFLQGKGNYGVPALKSKSQNKKRFKSVNQRRAIRNG